MVIQKVIERLREEVRHGHMNHLRPDRTGKTLQPLEGTPLGCITHSPYHSASLPNNR
jgi:hypothetical protein